jgi:hypothetical protein
MKRCGGRLKKRSEAVAQEAWVHRPGRGRFCLADGRCARSLYPTLRPAAAGSLL